MNAYMPQIDDLVWDDSTRKVGRIMDHVGPHWQLKPPGGGREWDAHGPLRPATPAEQESADVARLTPRLAARHRECADQD
ncbi:hypothetical protein [Streptomyces olivochromogenes]|uniref:hypothetical protein n=1 Tax=Streptomyces olivochromogenes TaxID=1963 RepID=UPI0027E48874|nr:hypothetical protein [Streptomyces olivochromogenes]